MKYTRKLAVGLAAAALTVSCFASELVQSRSYEEGMFSDVPQAAWYADDVKMCYEYGVMQGTGESIFLPDGYVSYAEALTLAARLHSVLHRKTIDRASDDAAWYEPYEAYAIENGLLTEKPDSYERAALRYEAAELVFKALSDTLSDAEKINEMVSIPDVPESVSFYGAVKALYEVGVLTGSDSYGNFYPTDTFTRAEAAAIMSRAAFADKRVKKSFDIMAEEDAYYLCYNYHFRSLEREWQRDERGAAPAQTLGSAFTGLFDIREDAGTALIRRFNRVSVGRITADIGVTARGDGAYLEFRNDEDAAVYRLEIIDGKWRLLGENGAYTVLCDAPAVSTDYAMRILLDLDNGYSETVINGISCGKHPLAVAKEQVNLYNFRFATTEKGTPTVKPSYCVIRANYAL